MSLDEKIDEAERLMRGEKVRTACLLRLPPELKVALAAQAQANGRSLNAEIVYRLTRSLDSYTR